MADYDSSLPIYSRADTAPVIVSKDTSANALANPIYVNLSDGSSGVSFTGSALDVNLSGSTGSLTVDAVDLDIRDLVHTQDSVALGDGTNTVDFVVVNSAYGATPTTFPVAGKYEATPTAYGDGDATPFLTDENGRLQVDISSISGQATYVDDSAYTIATDRVSASGYLADETSPDSVDEGDIGLARMTLDRKQLMVITDPTTDANRLAIDASGNIGVDIVSSTGSILVDVVQSGTSDPLYVQLTDGSTALSTTGSSLDVNVTGGSVTATVSGDVNVTQGTSPWVVSATDLDIRDLDWTQDSVEIGGVNITGSALDVNIGAVSDLDIRDLVHTQDDVAIGSGGNILDVNASGQAAIDIAAQSLTALKISKDANANAETNPIYVYNVSSVSSNEVYDYDTSVDVAKNGTDNHDYTITNGSTFVLKRVIASASGAMKVQVGIGDGSTIVATGFTSMAFPTLQLEFEPGIEQASTGTEIIRVARTNRDNQPMDVYSTILGNEI